MIDQGWCQMAGFNHHPQFDENDNGFEDFEAAKQMRDVTSKQTNKGLTAYFL